MEGSKKAQSASTSFVHANHDIWLKWLSGKNLDGIMAVYMHHFEGILSSHPALCRENWQRLNLHELLQKIIFDASALTFFGTRIKKLWPNMWEDWKTFNNATYAGVRSNAAVYLQPGASRARERMLSAFDEWVDAPAPKTSEGTWSEKWGIRMNLERERLARDFAFSLRGRSCLQASFLFVIVTNAAPMATSFTYCASHSKDHLERFRKEISITLKSTAGDKEPRANFDINALKKNQFVAGLWKEALRLDSASAAARVVMEDAELEGYTVKKGSVLFMPVHLMHFDPNVFAEPDEIQPERWIMTDADDEQQGAKLKRQNNALRSFGGGAGLCSGKFVAEEEILAVV